MLIRTWYANIDMVCLYRMFDISHVNIGSVCSYKNGILI